jgi:hypothetical protein
VAGARVSVALLEMSKASRSRQHTLSKDRSKDCQLLSDFNTRLIRSSSDSDILQEYSLEFRLNANDSVCTEFVITHFDK